MICMPVFSSPMLHVWFNICMFLTEGLLGMAIVGGGAAVALGAIIGLGVALGKKS